LKQIGPFDSFRLSASGLERLRITLGRLFSRFERSIVSAIYTHLPFKGSILLVVASSEETALPSLLYDIGQVVPRGVKVIVLRITELSELSFQNPYHPECASLTWWLRLESTVVYGVDIRSTIHLEAADPSLLACQISNVLPRIRKDIALGQLVDGKYARLIKLLDRERMLLALTALLLDGSWRIFPETLLLEMEKRERLTRVVENMREFTALSKSLEFEPHNGLPLALRGLWLTEVLVRNLRVYAA